MALTSLNIHVYLVTYLRYTAFIVLYPLGVACEMWSLYGMLPIATRTGFNMLVVPGLGKLPEFIQYPRVVRWLLVVYVPVWWSLYSFLWRQRAKKLGPGRASATRGGKAKAN